MINNRGKEPKFGKKPTRGKGFYIALAVSAACIGGAALTTFQSMKEFSDPEQNYSDSRISERFQNAPQKKDPTLRDKQGHNNNTKQAGTSPFKKEGDNAAKNAEQNEEAAANAKPSKKKADDGAVGYPLENKRVEKGFSLEKPEFSQTLGDWRIHDGVDFAAKEKEVVKAASNGKIRNIGKDELMGDYVVIDHKNGITTYYYGVRPKVKKDDNVNLGDKIGEISMIPSEQDEGSHLHLKVMRNDQCIDPIKDFLEAGRT
ncbi:MAG: M23 family metallopeptidase [Oscillospiraceae bacterium]|nr:M23 family metallopeptidase [Oscillospiraceae bacterium]